MDRSGTCIILDKKYNIANSSCHFWPYDPQCHELFAIDMSMAKIKIKIPEVKKKPCFIDIQWEITAILFEVNLNV